MDVGWMAHRLLTRAVPIYPEYLQSTYLDYFGVFLEGYLKCSCLLLFSPRFTQFTLTHNIMGWFSDDSDQAQAYEQVRINPLVAIAVLTGFCLRWSMLPHKAALSHELIAAAASYEVGIIVLLLYTGLMTLLCAGRQSLPETL